MIKKVEIIGEDVLDTCEEFKTDIEGRRVTSIDLSNFANDRKIVIGDEYDKKICELYVPQTMLVKVSYK